jgi:FKBP-type peptidyl-prolyl cis-trans isomerase (trigger factor)
MKADLVDVNDTRKNLTVEIPSDIVSAEIDRIARDYSRKARIPGFRPGKAPARVIKQRFKDQILHDVAHDLIPRAVDDVLRERGVEAVDTPDIRDVTVEEGRPLTFTASFDTLPPFDPGDYAAIALRRSSAVVEEAAVDQALDRLRDRAARYVPVEGRGIDHGDTVVLDLDRRDANGATETHKDVNVELGAKANPPGFDEQLLGLEAGAAKTFTIHYPADYAISELAGTDVSYAVTVKGLKRRVVPELDDEFAKDLGDFADLDALRERIRSGAARRRARAPCGADEAAGHPRAVRSPGIARRAGARSTRRGLRAPIDGPGDRSAPHRDGLDGVSGESARGGSRHRCRNARPRRDRAARAPRRGRSGRRPGSGALRLAARSCAGSRPRSARA